MIYRIAEAAHWTEAQQTGFFASPDLAAEGFIHLSERHQVAGVAQRYYRGKTGLTLIAVNESLLPSGTPVRRENTRGGTELFPHVYGPIPLGAVVHSAPFDLEPDGSVKWPAGW